MDLLLTLLALLVSSATAVLLLSDTSSAGLILVAVASGMLLVVVAARATMVTWITVLVLLAFSGMRRKVLVRRGREISAEVARFLIADKGLVALACAAILGFFAVVSGSIED